MVVIMSFRGSLAKDMNGVQIGFMIAVVLFELFNLMYSLFETHTFKSTSDDATEKEIEQEWEAEKNWRKKYFTKLNDSQFMKKELYANIILIAMAVVTTQIFWGNMNAEFVDFIKRTDKMGESVSFAILTVLISCFVLCLIFLMPVRLAFWIEEKMHADSKAQTSTYRWSLFFAGISICSPSLIQLVVSFIL